MKKFQMHVDSSIYEHHLSSPFGSFADRLACFKHCGMPYIHIGLQARLLFTFSNALFTWAYRLG